MGRRFSVPDNHIDGQYSYLEFNKKTVLIGGNGCGKSRILEHIFKSEFFSSNYTRHPYGSDKKNFVIGFSSGKNQRFSKITKPFFLEKHEKLRNLGFATYGIKGFYFDAEWSRLLIFFAFSIRNGQTRKFLIEKNYLLDDDILNSLAVLRLKLDIPTSYVNKIKSSYKRELSGTGKKSFRQTLFHSQLSKLIPEELEEYEFENKLKDLTIETYAADVDRVFGKIPEDIFSFFSILYSLPRNKQILHNPETIELFFENGLELSSLSDGEFQMLIILSIIDLFDGEDTVFIFDEIDSHLHSLNTKKLWEILEKTKGSLIATTHSMESIALQDFASLKFIDNAEIKNDPYLLESLINRINDFSENNSFQYKIAGNIEYTALVEDISDWYIFTKLVEKKLGHNAVNTLKKIQPIKIESGYNATTQDFGGKKIEWVRRFVVHNKENHKAKNILMLCDRDELPLADIKNDGTKTSFIPIQLKEKNNKPKAYLLIWKRRQIENYLLCHSLLTKTNKLEEINNILPKKDNIKSGDKNDNDSVRLVECKDIIKNLYSGSNGLDHTKLNHILSLISPEEISEDIENIYNFIVSKTL